MPPHGGGLSPWLKDVASALKTCKDKPPPQTHVQETLEFPFGSSLKIAGVGLLPLPLTKVFANLLVHAAAARPQLARNSDSSTLLRWGSDRISFENPEWASRVEEVTITAQSHLRLPKECYSTANTLPSLLCSQLLCLLCSDR
jgi:hypothetical protein